MLLSNEAFRSLVVEALGRVPSEFWPYLKEVAVVIEEWASDQLLAEMGIPEDQTLFGLYQGRAVTQGKEATGDLPPRITLYRGPLLANCQDESELRERVLTTVLHEVAHHFGIGEARLRALGWG